MTCRESLHLWIKSLLNKIFVYNFYYIYFSKTIPRKNIYLCIAALYINTAVSFKSNVTKNFINCWPPILDPISYSKRTSVFRISSQYYCVTCYNARKMNYFTRKGQFIKSGNFSISQGKLDSFKEARGRWHISAYLPKLNISHQKDIVSRN